MVGEVPVRIEEVHVFQVRIHGRGGQGVVTAAEMLSVAGFLDGRHAQAFPSFGSERMGAPVVAYCRIDERPIRSHDPIAEPDALVIQDPTLLHQVDLFAGVPPGGYILVNTARTFDELGLADLVERMQGERLVTVPATELAQRLIGRPVPNTALLGGLAELTGVVPLSALEAAIRRRFGGTLAAGNAAAATEAAAYVRAEREALDHA
jgi:pyruvate ferredoxin oxidoreductase gamma subunit